MIAHRGERSARGGRGVALPSTLLLLCGLALVGRLGAPVVYDLWLQTRAVGVMGEVDTVMRAAYDFRRTEGRWPADAPPGVIPPELVDHLPDGYSFMLREGALDWDTWSLGESLAALYGRSAVAAVTLSIRDPELARGIRRVAIDRMWFDTPPLFGFIVPDIEPS